MIQRRALAHLLAMEGLLHWRRAAQANEFHKIHKDCEGITIRQRQARSVEGEEQ